MSGIKNADGTVNFEGMKQHLNYVKGKYAQNAENYKKNTGHEMGFGDDKGDTGHHHVGADANSQGKDARTEGGDATDASQHDERKNE